MGSKLLFVPSRSQTRLTSLDKESRLHVDDDLGYVRSPPRQVVSNLPFPATGSVLLNVKTSVVEHKCRQSVSCVNLE